MIRHGGLPSFGSKSTNGSNNFFSLGDTNQVIVTEADFREFVRLRAGGFQYAISPRLRPRLNNVFRRPQLPETELVLNASCS
jgi:hypothetical protein